MRYSIARRVAAAAVQSQPASSSSRPVLSAKRMQPASKTREQMQQQPVSFRDDAVPEMKFNGSLPTIAQHAVATGDRNPTLWNEICRELYYWLPKHDPRSVSLAIHAMGKLGIVNKQLLDHIANYFLQANRVKNFCMIDLVALCQGFSLIKYPTPHS